MIDWLMMHTVQKMRQVDQLDLFLIKLGNRGPRTAGGCNKLQHTRRNIF